MEVLHAVLDGLGTFLASNEDGRLVVLDRLRFSLLQGSLAPLVPRLHDSLHQTHRCDQLTESFKQRLLKLCEQKLSTIQQSFEWFSFRFSELRRFREK